MSDYQDTPSVLADKVERLAALLKLSKVKDTYINLEHFQSKSPEDRDLLGSWDLHLGGDRLGCKDRGEDDEGNKDNDIKPEIVNVILLRQGGATTDAAPTPTHLALAALRAQGLVHAWIQQNHDGLPQKAGWPQVKGEYLKPVSPSF